MMNFFRKYIKSNFYIFIVTAVCSCIFAVIFALYGIPVSAAIYPAVLSIIVLLIVLIFNFASAYKKHKNISALKYDTDSLCEKIDDFQGLYDSDYAVLVKTLAAELSEQTSKAAEAEARSEEYYATWVHQIKIPIASMYLTLQNEDNAVSRSLREDLFRIEQYVDMVLTYQRLDSGSNDYVFREYNLDEILRQTIRKFAGQFISKGIKLDYAPTELRIVTDSKWLSFVIEQVLSNALKYTNKGSISIEVQSPTILTISDTGIGIEPEDLPRVFERSYTGCNGRADKKASGLGLYLCRRICDNFGYDISIESAPGIGTTVRIDLSKPRSLYE